MRFREHPLLNTPHLSTVLLRAAARGSATVAECAAQLSAVLEEVGEHPPVEPSEIHRRLDLLREDLTVARLIAPVGVDRFTLTERGRKALEEHPAGFARADLTIFPEYAAYVRRRSRRDPGLPADDPRGSAYDQGFAAYFEGRSLADNPYEPDTVDHLAWENGWSEAVDEVGGARPDTAR